MKISNHFYTEQQAADLLSINRITIWRWIKNGKFNIQRVGGIVLIPKREIDLIKAKREAKRKAQP